MPLGGSSKNTIITVLVRTVEWDISWPLRDDIIEEDLRNSV